MHTYNFFLLTYFVTIFVNSLIIIYVSKNSSTNGSLAFRIAVFFSSLWCIGTVMILSTETLSSKIFWAKISFPAYTFGPVAWMIMIFQITDYSKWINKKRLLLLCVIPIITVILAWTNDYHGLIWKNISVDYTRELHPLTKKYGLWFWVHAVYADIMNLISVVSIIRFWRSKAPLYKGQLRCLAYSMAFIIVVNASYVLGIGPKYDVTSIAWGISCLFIAWSFFRNRLFDLIPIARNRIVESMEYGIVVLDLKNRIVDINPFARQICNCDANIIGNDAECFFEPWFELKKLVSQNEEYIEYENENKYYEASGLSVQNDKGNLLGRFITIQDITQKKLRRQIILKEQKEIAVKEEREKMARDLHDNVGQIIGFINVQSQAIMEYVKKDEQETALRCVERLAEIAQEAHSSVREAILAMRGENVSMEKGMADLLTELNMQLSFFKKSYGIDVKLDYKPAENFDFSDSKVVFQVLNIIKEALNNIVKHSRASSANIAFEENDEGLNIVISDNGCGFDVRKISFSSENRYGLKFMKERAEEIGGSLEIYSETGNGTNIKLKIPIKLE